MYRFKNWFTPPTFEGDTEKTITAGLLNSILLTILIGPIVFSISAIINQENPTRSLTINTATFLLLGSLLIPLHKGFVKRAAVGTIVTMFTIFVFVATMHSGVSSPALTGLILVVMIAGLLLGKRPAFITAFLGACTALLLHTLNKAELIPFANSLQLNEISTWIILSVFLGISAVFVGMSRSMTKMALAEAEQRLAEQQEIQIALRASEGTVRALLEALPDVIFRIDRSGTFIDHIPAKDFETLVPPEEFLGRKLEDVLPSDLAELTQYYITRALDENLVQTYEYSLPSNEGLHFFEARMVKTDTDSVLAIVRDVTTRIKAKQKNEEVLRTLEQRNTQLRIAADVSKTCGSILNSDLLVQQAVDHIQHGFNLYYVGLFLVASEGKTAILIAGSGEVGRKLLADGHHLQLDEPSMVAWAIRNGRARIAQRAELDKERFSNPHLPNTRSELALPLISRGRVIGALTVQNTQENAFSEVDISSLQTMADQLGTAVENANLFEATQKEIEVRRLVENELAQERDFAVQMMNTLGQGVFVTDQKNKFEYVNPAFAKMLGQKPDDLLGKTVTNFANQEDIGKLDKGRSLRFRGVVSSYEARFQHSNGYDVHTLVTGAPRYQGERITGAIVATTDLTEQKRAQAEREMLLNQMKEKNEELERSAREMETLRQSAAIVASTLDQEQTINLILEQLERVIPYTSASVQLIRDNELEIVGGRGIPEGSGTTGTRYPITENTPDLAVIQDRESYVLFDDIQTSHVEFQQHPNNYFHSWIAVPLKVKDQVFGIITVDGEEIGQFTHRDAQLVSVFADQVAIAFENARLYSALQSELAMSEGLVTELESKNAELERFTYTVSHDLKSPLITIRGFLGYLENDAVDGNIERLKTDIERISNAAGKMGQLLDELLELSRVGRLMNDPEEVSFETIAREAVGLVEGRLKEGNIKVKINSNLPNIYVDRVRLVEVVQNLVDNAAKFVKEQPNPKIEIGVCDKDDEHIFYVKDNGIGIDPKYHEKIFGLFEKLDSNSEGTGVGLSLVKRIVEVHGGRIWVESGAGKGATFCFTLTGAPKLGESK